MSLLEEDRVKAIRIALEKLGGIGHYDEILPILREDPNFHHENFGIQKKSFSEEEYLKAKENSFQAKVREVIQKYSPDSVTYKNTRPEMFYSVNGVGGGTWGLIDYEILEMAEEEIFYPEGRSSYQIHKKLERNPKLVNDAKKEFKVKN